MCAEKSIYIIYSHWLYLFFAAASRAQSRAIQPRHTASKCHFYRSFPLYAKDDDPQLSQCSSELDKRDLAAMLRDFLFEWCNSTEIMLWLVSIAIVLHQLIKATFTFGCTEFGIFCWCAAAEILLLLFSRQWCAAIGRSIFKQVSSFAAVGCQWKFGRTSSKTICFALFLYWAPS